MRIMRIMRTVNSSYYSLQNKVADLKLAITLLGFKEIRNLAMTAYVSQLFRADAGHGAYSREHLWNHFIGVGSVARLIAETTRTVPPREAYLAGLLHDLGIILGRSVVAFAFPGGQQDAGGPIHLFLGRIPADAQSHGSPGDIGRQTDRRQGGGKVVGAAVAGRSRRHA